MKATQEKEEEKEERKEKEEKGKKIVEEKWSTLLNRAGFAIALLALVITLVVVKNFFMPATATEETGTQIGGEEQEQTQVGEEGMEELPGELGNISSIAEISEVSEVSGQNCTPLLSGGERSSYSYDIFYPSTNMTVPISSDYAGKEGDYQIRKTKMTIQQNFPEIQQEISGEVEMKIYMNENFSCIKITTSSTFSELWGMANIEEMGCNETGIGVGVFQVCSENFNYINDETISVKVGSFPTKLYISNDNSTKVWIGTIPVPIKIVSQETEMELTSFTGS